MNTDQAIDTPQQVPAVGAPLARGVRPLRWRLSAKTGKGKHKMREAAMLMPPSWNGVWVTLETRPAVAFAQGVDGPWHFVRPEGALFGCCERLTRWVHESRDDHFTLTAA